MKPKPTFNAPELLTVQRLYGNYVYELNECGDEHIKCRYGRIEARNLLNGVSFFVAVLVDPPSAVWRRMQKLELPLISKCGGNREFAYELVPGKTVKALEILKPMEPKGKDTT